MAKILYLMIGYPGAGKTTASEIIAELTGATHLWADAERHKMFPKPTHSEAESLHLYNHLNREAERLLSEGKSVVFDTNFNFYADRQLLRRIAERQRAECVIIWVATPPAAARRRAVGRHLTRNGYMNSMTDEQFDAIVSKLEPPRDNEKVIKIDGTKLDKQKLTALIK